MNIDRGVVGDALAEAAAALDVIAADAAKWAGEKRYRGTVIGSRLLTLSRYAELRRDAARAVLDKARPS
jgi:hypothetical protein